MRRLILRGAVDALNAWKLPAIEVLDLNMTIDIVDEYEG